MRQNDERCCWHRHAACGRSDNGPLNRKIPAGSQTDALMMQACKSKACEVAHLTKRESMPPRASVMKSSCALRISAGDDDSLSVEKSNEFNEPVQVVTACPCLPPMYVTETVSAEAQPYLLSESQVSKLPGRTEGPLSDEDKAMSEFGVPQGVADLKEAWWAEALGEDKGLCWRYTPGGLPYSKGWPCGGVC
jgi:hypothetical protein